MNNNNRIDPISHLITLLRSHSGTIPIETLPAILNNAIYYIPRARSKENLQYLVSSFFQSELWHQLKDPMELQRATQSIFQWKLEISEPIINLNDFFYVWNHSIINCNKWDIIKLSILSGIISTNETFLQLQKQYFLDDSGRVQEMYTTWKQKYFLPIWCQSIHQWNYKPNDKSKSPELDDLVLIYSASQLDDSNMEFLMKNNIPWNFIVESCMKLSIQYITKGNLRDKRNQNDKMLQLNLNQVAKTLMTGIPRCDIRTVSKVLNNYTSVCFDVCTKEVNHGNSEIKYADEYYSNIFIFILLTLKSCLQRSNKYGMIPELWYNQIILCLFYLNFIALDFGTVGFQLYDYVYDVTVTGIKMTSNIQFKNNGMSYYEDIINNLKGNIWLNDNGFANKINKSKMTFFLIFLQKTLPGLDGITGTFYNETITPLEYLCFEENNKDETIRDLLHGVILSVFDNIRFVSGTGLLIWQADHLLRYINLCYDQYHNKNNLSEKQLLIIIQTLGPKSVFLRTFNRDLTGELLHLTYLRVINCSPNEVEQQKTFIKCIIFLLSFTDDRYMCDWLDNIRELILKTKLDKKQYNELLHLLWNVISDIKSGTAIKWWYMHKESLRSKL
ncbi:Pex8p NDAI_0B02630 [Naumovozyma dairenensis CBS 421]|uniref:Uncharacterized protein n=1 Tax=Naumovozyma dairenensis (strain ATCC 10597 / BCRC 20456 / CBS 421 / NBRC 0211 / NRRL Y-12639) TaxID=1071378 RepID=G0W687_NAUDC|nr:hypothetical protein NDAI_0B02630 [Naumovozyma dairenensis CBS 421]CCD23298.1 hypothetical protein NDAI_0B02630 [Naumovozyma dairenensis CBS 421]